MNKTLAIAMVTGVALAGGAIAAFEISKWGDDVYHDSAEENVDFDYYDGEEKEAEQLDEWDDWEDQDKNVDDPGSDQSIWEDEEDSDQPSFDDFDCFRQSTENDVKAETIQTGQIKLLDDQGYTWSTVSGTAQLTVYTVESIDVPSINISATNVQYYVDGEWFPSDDLDITCHPDSKTELIVALDRWDAQIFESENDYETLNCIGLE